MFIAASFVIVKTWKLLKCVSLGQWLNKHVMEYYSPIRRNDLYYTKQIGWTPRISC